MTHDANDKLVKAEGEAVGPNEPKSENPPLLWTESWRPIESAPKDGTEVVVFTEWKRAVVASWQDGYENEAGACCCWVARDEDDAPACWTDGVCWAVNAEGEPSDQPTHWMPLPAVPGGCLEDQERLAAKDDAAASPQAPVGVSEPSAEGGE